MNNPLSGRYCLLWPSHTLLKLHYTTQCTGYTQLLHYSSKTCTLWAGVLVHSAHHYITDFTTMRYRFTHIELTCDVFETQIVLAIHTYHSLSSSLPAESACITVPSIHVASSYSSRLKQIVITSATTRNLAIWATPDNLSPKYSWSAYPCPGMVQAEEHSSLRRYGVRVTVCIWSWLLTAYRKGLNFLRSAQNSPILHIDCYMCWICLRRFLW